MTLVNEKCEECKFCKMPHHSEWRGFKYCDYLCMAGERRGCSAGYLCDKFIQRTKKGFKKKFIKL